MNRVREARERKGMRREELAASVPCSLSLIYRLETTDLQLKLSHARAIARALDLALDYLFPADVSKPIHQG